MAFFPRFSGEFAPLFHLLNDYDEHRSCRPKNKVTSVRTFAPKFDVYEVNNGYHLNGELPGVDQSNVEIEFTDPNTLVIKGRAERNYDNINTNNTDSETNDNTSYRKPTVEDGEEDENYHSDSSSATTPASSVTHEVVTKTQPTPAYKYWVSERSIGEFQRTFTFPSRIDQDAVRASLRDGILSVVVPKEAAPKLKKILVE